MPDHDSTRPTSELEAELRILENQLTRFESALIITAEEGPDGASSRDEAGASATVINRQFDEGHEVSGLEDRIAQFKEVLFERT
ncbi:MAG: hypothetical protein BMS9Abin12_2125 [Acidimicrobiia bacterium]|nr:MAG: hypothetical protein BMS9Abin12_2125 [Acidimicrobiia bacterium]